MITTINDKEFHLSEDDLKLNLLFYLREKLNITGPKIGCEIGACGVCTILIDSNPVQSCRKEVADIINSKVMTIEGLQNKDGSLHPLQQAFIDAGAVQCGYCTPAMVLRGHALLSKNNKPTKDEIKTAINPVLCRCTGYQQIIEAIINAAKNY